MEGQLCSESGCSCSDFLPFECSLCENLYCLDHRSRFSHTCSGLKEEYERKINLAAKSQPSVKEMMSSVENRFANEKTSSGKQHVNVKTSSAETLPALNQKFTEKMSALDRVAEKSASSKQRKISLKAKEMLIKSKATGNDSIPGKDRMYLSVHFTDSLDNPSAEDDHKVTYFFFSHHKPLGEVLQHIMQLHFATVEQSSCFQQNSCVNTLPREGLSLVLATADTPDWHMWERNTALKDCLSNFEDVAVFAAPAKEVMENQDELAYVREFGPRVVEEAVSMKTSEEEDLPPYVPAVYVKEQLAWYHKVPSEVYRRLSIEAMEETQPMIMVSIVGVHHDDFPNVYYTVRLKNPIVLTGVPGCEELTFHTEKQTDHTHLSPVSEGFGKPKAAPRGASAAGNAAAERSERSNAAKYAAQQLQQTLCTNGTPVAFKVGFSNRDYEISIGSLCTVAQLKLLISAITDVPVPDMKLICKGVVLKINNQQIKDTKIGNNSKVVVMSSGAHTV